MNGELKNFNMEQDLPKNNKRISLDRTLEFVSFLMKFRDIYRTIIVGGSDPKENDAEHSFQLAMVAWYIIEAYELPLDTSKVLKYALVHDLVEVYAGDVYAFSTDPQIHANKKQKEHDAFLKIKEEWKDFPSLEKYIEIYETKADQESLFVYALDKVLPDLNILHEGGTWYKTVCEAESLDELEKHHRPKVAQYKIIEKLWDDITQFGIKKGYYK